MIEMSSLIRLLIFAVSNITFCSHTICIMDNSNEFGFGSDIIISRGILCLSIFCMITHMPDDSLAFFISQF